jgi:hypothetical protein
MLRVRQDGARRMRTLDVGLDVLIVEQLEDSTDRNQRGRQGSIRLCRIGAPESGESGSREIWKTKSPSGAPIADALRWRAAPKLFRVGDENMLVRSSASRSSSAPFL